MGMASLALLLLLFLLNPHSIANDVSCDDRDIAHDVSCNHHDIAHTKLPSCLI